MQARDVALKLNSVAIHLVRRARAVDSELGVPPGQLSALSVLVFGGERTIAQLAATEQVTSPTMTGIVAGLERGGLATRRTHPSDRRSSLIAATAKGRRLMERGRQRRVDVIAELLAGLTDVDLRAIDRATDALARAMQG
jgi:DNA-binding MarR family transcriptional regulator